MKAVDQTWATSMSRTAVTQAQSGVSCTRPARTPTARRTIDSRALPRKAPRSTPGEKSQRLGGAVTRGTVAVHMRPPVGRGHDHGVAELCHRGHRDHRGKKEATGLLFPL